MDVVSAARRTTVRQKISPTWPIYVTTAEGASIPVNTLLHMNSRSIFRKHLLRSETKRIKFYAWPRPLAKLFERNGVVLSIATSLGLTVVLALVSFLSSPGVIFSRHLGPGAF